MSFKPTAVLLISCPDQRGLVARVADFVFRHNGNIIHSDHHTDGESATFLMRVEWEMEGFGIPREEIAQAFAPLADSMRMQWELHFSDRPQRIAILVSKYNHCLYDLLWRNNAGELRGEIALVLSNHPDLEPDVRRFSIPYSVFPITPETKPAVEQEELKLLTANRIDLVVLARYMQVLSASFVAHYPNRIINIHHSFLPAFSGARPYHQAHERGVKLIGATSHYVTAQLDEGPIIEQDLARVSHRDTVEDLVRKGRDLERIVLARAVRLHLEHRVLPYGIKTVVFD
ncbi:MAG: formyltetrahydrofolate deformylase [Acidobacteria bacterium RIFCSPLOWO2_12_FULL_59_11]|nr:MAG: formyltetrahydrofolate deformylase [Acidobacteria bacterium RIFCSPLOWO2_12_FULL_59_11]